MLERIPPFFVPPRYADEMKTRLAALIYRIVLVTMGLAILNVILVAVAIPSALSHLWMNGLFLGLGVGLLLLVRRGYECAAGVILCLIIWSCVTIVLFSSEGLMNPSYGAYTLVIVVATLLLGWRGGFAFTLLVFLTSLGLWYADTQQLIGHGTPSPDANFFATGMVIFITVGILLSFAVRNLNQVLDRARRSETTLSQQNETLQNEVAERRHAEEALRTREAAARQFQERLKTLNEVSIELGKAATFDDLCKAAIELGRERLGFDRMGMWFLEADQHTLTGSFGTDEQGNTRDERHTREMAGGDRLFMQAIERKLRLNYEADTMLYDHRGEVVGKGWLAESVLWDGDLVMGYLSADNFFNRRPLLEADLETLTLYGAVLGSLCKRKRAEQALQSREQTGRAFQERLKALNEVNIELTKAAIFDDLCRRAVELGLERLGFDRLGIWFMNEDGVSMHGSFGVDEEGNVRDERGFRAYPEDDPLILEATQKHLRIAYDDDVPLVNHKAEVVGRGWNANATLWDGDKAIGWISADNFLRKEPLTDSDLETLLLYGAVLGNLFTRKQAEEGLRTSEERARQFQERLKILNEVNIELAKAESFDDLCRGAVELGRDRLGFDRIGIWLWSPDDQRLISAFGTDEHGVVTDERGLALRFRPDDFYILKVDNQTLHIIGDDVPLRNSDGNVIGQGWNVMATFWDGKEAIGWFAADNLLRHKPRTTSDTEIIQLFSLALGNLFARKRTEEKLQAERNLLRTIIDTTPGVVYVKDLQARFMLVNRKTFIDHVKSKQDVDMIGKSDFDFSPPELASQYYADDQFILSSGTSVLDKEEPGLDNEGRPITLLTSKIPLRNAQGDIIGLVGISRDITPYKQVESALRASEEAARAFQERLKVLHEVTLELSHIQDFDELCRASIELGRERLGFDRVGIWLWSTDGEEITGTFGTTEEGTTRDERAWRRKSNPDDIHVRLAKHQMIHVLGEDVPLRNEKGDVVGRGWNVMATLWDGNGALGWLAVDNLMRQKPLTSADQEILKLYSLALGNLFARKRTEDQLRDERNLLRAIIDTTPDLVYVKDLESKFVLVNRRSFVSHPHQRQQIEVKGKTDFDFSPQEIAERYHNDDQHIFKTGESILDKEEPGIDDQGQPIVLLTSKIALRDAQNEVIGLVGVSRDITPFKRVENALRTSEEAARAFQERLKTLYEVSLDLARIQDFDDLCRVSVELGRERLGFDRVGIWLLDVDPGYQFGSFGTDEDGNTRDERGVRLPLKDSDRQILYHMLEEGSYYFIDSGPIFNQHSETVATGQKGMAALSDGHVVIGAISIDNLLHHRPITQQDLEILVLYAATLGYLCSRKRAEEALLKERNLLRTIIDILPDRIFVKDTQSRLMLVNKASWIHTPGVSSEDDMLGMSDADIMPADVAAQLIAAERHLFESGEAILNQEEPVRDYEGHHIHFLSTKVPLRDAQGNIVGLVGVSRDITDQKRAEQQRLELALQKERLDLLTEFIGNMSHDLKTPLSVIKTTLYLMERITDPVRQEAKLQVIKEQTLRLEKLIQDVITMSRLEHGVTPVFDKIDLNRIILDVESKLHPTAERKHLNIHMNLDPTIPSLAADENELWRMLANLYENALHYTPEHGSITLSTHAAANKIIAEIQDTGIGIGQADLPHIFDRFYRADPARSIERGGTGLGLAIVKRIVELHRGEIEVLSEEGSGSLFRVSLPCGE